MFAEDPFLYIYKAYHPKHNRIRIIIHHPMLKVLLRIERVHKQY